MITKTNLLDLSQLIQDDLICALDGCNSIVIDNACQIVVDRIDRMTTLINDLESEE